MVFNSVAKSDDCFSNMHIATVTPGPVCDKCGIAGDSIGKSIKGARG